MFPLPRVISGIPGTPTRLILRKDEDWGGQFYAAEALEAIQKKSTQP